VWDRRGIGGGYEGDDQRGDGPPRASRARALDCSVVQLRSETAAASVGLSERLAGVGRLIDGGRLGEARIELEQSPDEPPELVELMRLKLRVVAREIEPSTALARIVALLERFPKHPAAMSMYRELSMLQYEAGQSCPSFSHPPPRSR
jgi:hypothetical protein